jgi:hypothetical protein
MVLWLEGLGKLEFEFELIERASLACKKGVHFEARIPPLLNLFNTASSNNHLANSLK